MMTYFDHIIGHDKIKTHLQELVSRGTLPHSLLFYGENGLGKLLMAQALASTIVKRPVFTAPQDTNYLEYNRQQRKENGEGAKQVESEGLPLYIDKGDVFWLRPMKATLRIEQWQLLLSKYLTQAADYPRVVIVEEFQTANAVFVNAMLKTIEEPPAQVYFILITSQRVNILPTIRSRCMSVSFTPLETEVLREGLLKKGCTGDVKTAAYISQGNVAAALLYLQNGIPPMLSLALRWLRELPSHACWFSSLSLSADELTRDECKDLLQWLRVLGRDLAALRFGAVDTDLQCEPQKAALVELLSHWSTKALAVLVAETLQAEEALRLHVRQSLIIDGLLITLHKAIKEEVR